ncbi:MAG: hypothetical protein Q7S87_16035 [Agitococcus sp.]|nr:hypothetical protein [Agitococcus sp.]MDO9176946.1 hypothetical protein [Agitococcus sp.]
MALILASDIDETLARVGFHEESGYGQFNRSLSCSEKPFQVRTLRNNNVNWLGWRYYESHLDLAGAKAACKKISGNHSTCAVAIFQYIN